MTASRSLKILYPKHLWLGLLQKILQQGFACKWFLWAMSPGSTTESREERQPINSVPC